MTNLSVGEVKYRFTRIIILVCIFYMGRMSTISEPQVFGLVGEHLAKYGSITLRDIVKGTGVSVGSLYHRYGSREELLACAARSGLSRQNRGAANEGERAAMATPRFCRDNPERARILVCCRREELISDTLPEPLTVQIQDINTDAAKRIKRFAKLQNYSLEACMFGLVAFPLGAVRLYLPNQKIPMSVDSYVKNAYLSAVRL